MAFGVTLPLLPGLVEQAGGGALADMERHTGWITGVYTLALFLFAPAWGALADRVDRRWVLIAGMAGSSAALWSLTLPLSILGLYAMRALAGVAAAAVLPAVFAYVVTASPPSRLQRRFAWVASATALGFLLGPAVGDWLGGAAPHRMLDAPPLDAVAIVGLLAAVGVMRLAPNRAIATTAEGAIPADRRQIVGGLLLTAIVVLAITVAEVGVTLTVRRAPTTLPVSVYFALCSGVMIAVQFWALPPLERRLGEPCLVVLAFAVLATGLGLLGVLGMRAGAPAIATAFVFSAAAIGVLIPTLAVRISAAGGTRQGWAMGWQAAAANLGQAAGAAVTGSLFALSPPSPFLVASGMAGATACAAAWQTTRRRAQGQPPSGA